jgi:hypothetical protein
MYFGRTGTGASNAHTLKADAAQSSPLLLLLVLLLLLLVVAAWRGR